MTQPPVPATPAHKIRLPWDKGFTPPTADPNLIGAVTGALERGVQDATQAATSLGSSVAGAVAGPAASTAVQDAGKVITDVEQAAGQVASTVSGGVVAAPSPVPAPTPASPVSAPSGGSLIGDIEQAALGAAKQSASSLLPGIEAALEKRIAVKVQAEITDVLTKVEGGSEPAVPTLDDFTKADARSRAIRTLIIGLVLSGLWGVVNVLGNVATVNWADRNALPQVLALVVGSVVSAVTGYIARVLKTPPHIANATILPGSS